MNDDKSKIEEDLDKIFGEEQEKPKVRANTKKNKKRIQYSKGIYKKVPRKKQ